MINVIDTSSSKLDELIFIISNLYKFTTKEVYKKYMTNNEFKTIVTV